MLGSPITGKAPIGNVVDYLFEISGAPGHAGRPALLLDDPDRTVVTYGALQARVCQAGHYLRALGIGPGDRVMFSVMDGLDFEALFLGGIKIGAVTLPINTWLKPQDYAYYVNDSGCRAVVIDHSLVPLFEGIRDRLESVGHIVVCGRRVEGYPFLEDELDRFPGTLETFPQAPDDTAFWLYSSGSTGDPKGVVHTHEHIYWATELFGIAAQKIALPTMSSSARRKCSSPTVWATRSISRSGPGRRMSSAAARSCRANAGSCGWSTGRPSR